MRLIFTLRLFFLFLLFPVAGHSQSALQAALQEIQFEGDTIEAVFKYVANTIRYDTKFKDATPEYHSYDEVLHDVLDDKKGVCMHYAALFHALCKELGYKSYIVSGYTKFMNQPPGKVPHAWNAVKIKGEWFLFDPTWASGYVMRNEFYPFYEKTWYKLTPEEFIYSHIPFDPVFQFRDFPASHIEIAGNHYTSKNKTHVDFEKLLEIYDNAEEVEKLHLSLSRITSAGINNDLINHKVQYIKEQIQIHHHNRQVYAYSQGVELLKKAKDEYEIYLSAKQKFFKDWAEEEITEYLQSFAHKTKLAHGQLATLNVEDERFARAVRQNIHFSSEMLQTIEQEEQFINKYLKTWKPLRIFSFL